MSRGIGTYDFVEKLKGAMITDARMQNGDLYLVGEKEGVKYEFRIEPEGDCCSSSWIESVNSMEDLIGSEIYDYEHVSGDTQHTEWGKIDYDFYKFRCSKGYVDIEMRNESNGYYSGWLNYFVSEL